MRLLSELMLFVGLYLAVVILYSLGASLLTSAVAGFVILFGGFSMAVGEGLADALEARDSVNEFRRRETRLHRGP